MAWAVPLALVLGAVGFASVAQSDSAPKPPKTKQEQTQKILEARKAGKGQLVGPEMRYSAVWRNGKYHIVKVREPHYLVDVGGEFGQAEVVEPGPPEPADQLPPVDPAFNGVQPTPEQTATVTAQVDALNEALGIPKPRGDQEPPGPRPQNPKEGG